MRKDKKNEHIRIKVTPKEEQKQKIDIATQTLERNIGFINSCDTKTSIILASIGVLLTIILTNDGLSTIWGIITSCCSGKTFCDILYLCGFFASASTLVIGIWKLVSVLIAKTEPPQKGSNTTSGPSIIFFGGILKVGDRAAYRDKFLAMSDCELLDELIAEIYVNAEIATQKYRRYNHGIKLSVWGFVLFALILLSGAYIYG